MERRQRITGLKGSWEWLNFAAQLPANPVQFSGVAGGRLVYSGRCILTGGAFSNSATTAGSVSILDGQDGNGGAVAFQAVAASAGVPLVLPGQGILLEVGAYMVASAAVLAGALYLIPLWHDEYTAPGD